MAGAADAEGALPPPQGLQTMGLPGCHDTVGLDEMSPQEQRRCRKRWAVRHAIARLRHFATPAISADGEECHLHDVHSTTPDDITAQLLAYLFQEEMVPWEEIEPWVKHYAPWGHATEGARWTKRAPVCHHDGIGSPVNPIRSVLLLPRAEPGGHSIPQAAKVLGITERQLRYMIDKKRFEVLRGWETCRHSACSSRISETQVIDTARPKGQSTTRDVHGAGADRWHDTRGHPTDDP